ncbi:hypothetical protein CBR_g34090 [Chara braunii]|uniref:Reverse transcriptase n=1 Tax=Chara braunii TaxID=69332 RepID=A0A388LI09_CHABU|nr:hypothetical protein CBR_g34090 [Chara braunii]|eukprot:GBG81907.1 hypothetical protein CBR_g34090 [Chara braunii]
MVSNSNLCGRAVERGIGNIVVAHQFDPGELAVSGVALPVATAQHQASGSDDRNGADDSVNGHASSESSLNSNDNNAENTSDDEDVTSDKEVCECVMPDGTIGRRLYSKTLADVVEALAGVYYTEVGSEGALKLLSWFGIHLDGSHKILQHTGSIPGEVIANDVDQVMEDVTKCANGPPEAVSAVPGEHVRLQIGDMDPVESSAGNMRKVEEIVCYRFKHPKLLLQAFMHTSYADVVAWPCYQRLEFLGDALIDWITTVRILTKNTDLEPGQLSVMRAMAVCNETLARVAVRFSLQQHLRHASSDLMNHITSFAEAVRKEEKKTPARTLGKGNLKAYGLITEFAPKTRSGKDTSPYTLEQLEKMAALVKENRERKELEKQAKLKAIAEEQATKMKRLEEEMKRVQQEEEERRKAAEEEAAAEEEKERMRIESREGSSGTKRDTDAEMEKKISEWVANLSLGEDEEAESYVTQDERDALASELAAMTDPMERREREEEEKLAWKLRMKREKKRRREEVNKLTAEVAKVQECRKEVEAQADDKAKWDKAGITYDALSREVVLYESKSMPVTTFWHKDLDQGKRWKGRTISGQVRAKDHMILTLEEGGTDEVPYSQTEWGLEEEDSSVGQGRSYAAVAAGGRPQGRGGGQGQRGQAMGGRGSGAQGVGGQGNRQAGGRGQGPPSNRQGSNWSPHRRGGRAPPGGWHLGLPHGRPWEDLGLDQRVWQERVNLDNTLAHCCLSAPAFARLVEKGRLEEQVFVVYVRPVIEAKENDSSTDPTIAKLLEEFQDLTESPTGVVPRPIQHRIEIEPGSRTPKGAVYKMSPKELEELRKQLDELLEKGWIRPSSSPFGAPVLFVPKKEGELRMCIDYRGLNAITVKTEPLPRIDDLLDRVQGCKYFSKIDLKSGYHQMEVHPNDQCKVAFRTRYGHYEFIVMPFGLTNAPATFQCCMNDLFRPWLDKFVVVYLDDILVFSKTLQEQQGHLRQVLEKLREANFKINPKKCEWAKTEVLYLGHVLDGDGIKPEDSKIAAIRHWSTPRTSTELRSFLGLANYYRKFVRNFFTIAAPLRRLLKKEAIWQWDKECTFALKRLKCTLIEYPVLKVADPSLPFVVTTHASQYGIGVVLQQDDGNGYRPVEFMLARMPLENAATSTYERELYALRQALEHWKHYVLGRHFKVYSDHETLRWLKTRAKMTPKLTRWAAEIDQYDFELKPVKGKYNVVADALSRRSDYFKAIVLGDIVESLIGAIFVDSEFDLRPVEKVCKEFLPEVTPETVGLHPVTQFFELCQAHAKHGELVSEPLPGGRCKVKVLVDGENLGEVDNSQKKLARKLAAALVRQRVRIAADNLVLIPQSAESVQDPLLYGHTDDEAGALSPAGESSASDAEKPHLQALLDNAIKKEQEAEKERKESLLKSQVAILENVPSLTEVRCGEQLQTILTALVQVRNIEDHNTQIADVFAKLRKLQDDLADMTLKYQELTQEVVGLRHAQVANPLPLPPGSKAAIGTTSASLTVSSSLNVLATPLRPATGANSAVVVASDEAGNSATAAAPRLESVGAGPSYVGPYVDRKAVQMPSKYDGKEDIESWIGSMRAYFEILGTQPETQALIMGMNIESVVRGFLEVQATRAGFQKTALAKWLRTTPVASLEDLLISQYYDPHATARARIQLDKVKRSKWTSSMKSLQTYLSKMFASPGLELTAQSCLDVVKGAVPINFTNGLGRDYIAYIDWLTLMKDIVSLEAVDLVSTTSSEKPMGGRRFKGSSRFAVHDLLEAEEEVDADDPTLGDDQEQDSDTACSSAHESDANKEEEQFSAFKQTGSTKGPNRSVGKNYVQLPKGVKIPPKPEDASNKPWSQCEWTKWKESLFMVKDAQGNELLVLLDEKRESLVTFLNALKFCKKWRQQKEDEQSYVAFVRPAHVPSTFTIRNPLSYLFPEQPAGLTPDRPGFRAKYDRLLKVAIAAMAK